MCEWCSYDDKKRQIAHTLGIDDPSVSTSEAGSYVALKPVQPYEADVNHAVHNFHVTIMMFERVIYLRLFKAHDTQFDICGASERAAITL